MIVLRVKSTGLYLYSGLVRIGRNTPKKCIEFVTDINKADVYSPTHMLKSRKIFSNAAWRYIESLDCEKIEVNVITTRTVVVAKE